MKGRESGMPPKNAWEEFFETGAVLEAMGVDESVENAVDFGCGYGTFSITAAKKIRGKLYAMDIDQEMISATQEEADGQRIKNIETIYRDFIAEGTGLKGESVDYVMLFNILHVEDPLSLLKEAYRLLRKSGRVGIIHWNYDPKTPRGPSMEIRPKPENCVEWAKKAGFSEPRQFDLKPYHYGIVLEKK